MRKYYLHMRKTKAYINCATAHADLRLWVTLPGRYNLSSFLIQNFKDLTSFYSCVSRDESDLVGNPNAGFLRDEAQFLSAPS